MAILAERGQLKENRLLAAISQEERDRLRQSTQLVQVTPHQTIHMPCDPIQSVYFPINSVLSLITVLADGSSTGIAMVGSEGAAGLPTVLGSNSELFFTMVLTPGIALRVSACVLSAESCRHGALEGTLLRYTQSLFDQVVLGMACGLHHSIKQRLASWLLMIRDRVRADQLPLTHELLAQLLGVNRPSLTLAIAALDKAGLICHSRGIITVVDSEGLEAMACECTQSMRNEYQSLIT